MKNKFCARPWNPLEHFVFQHFFQGAQVTVSLLHDRAAYSTTMQSGCITELEVPRSWTCSKIYGTGTELVPFLKEWNKYGMELRFQRKSSGFPRFPLYFQLFNFLISKILWQKREKSYKISSQNTGFFYKKRMLSTITFWLNEAIFWCTFSKSM